MPIAEVHVTLKPALFDAQGETIKKALHQLGYSGVQNVRIGKYITLEVEGIEESALQSHLDLMCQQLLSNPVIEDYEVTLPANALPTESLVAPTGAPGIESVALTPVLVPDPQIAAANVPVTSQIVSSPGGITDPFQIDFRSYEAMATDMKLALKANALRKYGSWINTQFNSRGALWILCIGQEVVESGPNLDTYPSDQTLLKYGIQYDRVPWVFTKPN